MKTAVIQFGTGKDKDKNVQKAIGLVKKAVGARAKCILLPEVFMYRGSLSPQEARRVAENVSGPTVKAFAELAKKHKKYILLGSIYERSRQIKVYNTSILLNPQGRVQAKYRKRNLFDAKVGPHKLREADCFLKGSKTALAKIGPFKAGLSICYDLRFPELYLNYRKKGAEVLFVPSAFTQKTGMAHWKTLLRARAIENQCYVLAPNQIGRDGRGVLSYGHSMIIDPWGKVLAEASGYKNEIIYATLKKQTIQNTRKIIYMQRKS